MRRHDFDDEGHEVRVPSRTVSQRMDALHTANDIRTYRANLKRDLKAGRENVIDLLMDPPQRIETMKVFELMMSVPMLGRTKVNKLLIKCKISPAKTVGGLSDRQRDELVYFLRKR